MAPKNAAIAVKKKQATAAAKGGQKSAHRSKVPKGSRQDATDEKPVKRRSGVSASADRTAPAKTAKQQKAGDKKAADEQPSKPAKQPSKRKATAAAEASTEPARKRKTGTEASVGQKGSRKGGKSAEGSTADAPDSMKPTALAEHTDFFLVKDEPGDYSIDDLEKEGTAEWDGVRNYQARNIMQRMKVGNQVLFYRSGTKHPGLVGLAEVSRAPYPDHTSWDEDAKAYDPKSTPDNPRWFMVDIKFQRKFDKFVSLDTLKEHKDSELAELALFKMSRLSVMALTKEHFDFMMKLADDAQAEQDK